MNNNKFIITILICSILLCSLPIVLFSIKLNFARKELHVDNKRYEYINDVCTARKDFKVCEKSLREDLNILLYAHKKNKEYISVPLSILRPDRFLTTMYKDQENISLIEPEIVLKSLLLKKVLFKDLSDVINAGIFDTYVREYIVNNFSSENKDGFLKLIDSQNRDFEKYKKKIDRKNKKTKRPEHKEIYSDINLSERFVFEED